MTMDDARKRIQAALDQFGNRAGVSLELLIAEVRSSLGAESANDLIDEFDLDDLIHRYKRSARELWKFCGSSGGQWLQAASALTFLRERGEGVHHIKEQVPADRIEQVLADYRAKGVGVLQHGNFEIDYHYNLDTELAVRFIFELGNCPPLDLSTIPHSIYPPE
jgi:hypothetical protein